MPLWKNSRKLSTRFYLQTGAVFLLAALFVIMLVNHEMRQQALHDAERTAILLINRNQATHQYFAQQLKPEVFALNGDGLSEAYFSPIWMSSIYAVGEMNRALLNEFGAEYNYREVAIHPRNPKNEAQPHEREFLTRLNQDPALEQAVDIQYLNGQPYLYVLRRGLVVEESCLQCHSTPERAPQGLVARYGPTNGFGLQVGDVVSVVSVHVPLADAYANSNRFSFQLSVLLSGLLAVLFGAVYWLNNRMLFKPLSRLRKITAHLGPAGSLREPALDSEELEPLAQVVENALRAAHNDQLRLEALVNERTSELQTANQLLSQDLENHQGDIERTTAEKEMLVREVNHRAKNNLAMIASLLDLQAQCSPDERVRELLLESVGRVRSLGLVHEELYRSERLVKVNMKTYLEKLTDSFIRAFGNPGRTKIHLRADEIMLGADQAVPVGLMVNELLSNSFKYALADQKTGDIWLEFRRSQSGYRLQVRDCGSGLPDGFEMSQVESLGLKLVGLLAGQLKGRIEIKPGPGAQTTIEFPDLWSGS